MESSTVRVLGNCEGDLVSRFLLEFELECVVEVEGVRIGAVVAAAVVKCFRVLDFDLDPDFAAVRAVAAVTVAVAFFFFCLTAGGSAESEDAFEVFLLPVLVEDCSLPLVLRPFLWVGRKLDSSPSSSSNVSTLSEFASESMGISNSPKTRVRPRVVFRLFVGIMSARSCSVVMVVLGSLGLALVVFFAGWPGDILAGDDGDDELLLSGGANMSSSSSARSLHFLPDCRRAEAGMGGRAGCGDAVVASIVARGELVRPLSMWDWTGSEDPNFLFFDDVESCGEFVAGVMGALWDFDKL